MALLNRTKSANNPTDDARIPDPRDDPDYAAAAALLASFNARYDGLEQEKQKLDLEARFAGRSARDDGPALRELRARLAALRALPPLKPMQAAAPAATSPAIAAGIALLQGQPVAPAPSYAAQITAIDAQLSVLSSAIRDQSEVCDGLLREQIEVCAKQVLPRWNSMVIEMYRDAQQLSRSTTRFRAFRAQIVARGICTETLKSPNVVSPLQLGAEDDFRSEISRWREILAAWGLLNER
jgi:hypothetical protein